MTEFDLALCRSVTALTHWTMANKAHRQGVGAFE